MWTGLPAEVGTPTLINFQTTELLWANGGNKSSHPPFPPASARTPPWPNLSRNHIGPCAWTQGRGHKGEEGFKEENRNFDSGLWFMSVNPNTHWLIKID
jgi:hypothetical protein